ncbi:hypothetical protein WR25_12165 [Diploscapter pachys]|uniref:Uncharacterized protein n=1 Tax=Diploscapter pachys TaxID=2018661 RepID=A0A2A2KW16_9BILA|nr:hypothetical protein WR25_12165 [Diploscapter pachys]
MDGGYEVFEPIDEREPAAPPPVRWDAGFGAGAGAPPSPVTPRAADFSALPSDDNDYFTEKLSKGPREGMGSNENTPHFHAQSGISREGGSKKEKSKNKGEAEMDDTEDETENSSKKKAKGKAKGRGKEKKKGNDKDKKRCWLILLAIGIVVVLLAAIVTGVLVALHLTCTFNFIGPLHKATSCGYKTTAKLPTTTTTNTTTTTASAAVTASANSTSNS